MVRVGILGSAGYTGGELLRILVNHPEVRIIFANSESNAGRPVSEVHTSLEGETDLRFTDELPFAEVDVVFLCFGHGKSGAFLREHEIPANVRIIDLAQDFRLHSVEHDFVYGLPEMSREAIRGCRHLANPGCFATCIQLCLLPLAKAGLLGNDVSINAMTGSTGAGQKPSATTHFSWRSDNVSIYKVFSHQHLLEIRQSLEELSPAPVGSLDFIPYRGPFARGIFCTCAVRFDGDEGTPSNPSAQQLEQMYRDFYSDSAFTRCCNSPVDLKMVTNTNKALIHIDKFGSKAVISGVIDNLLKGASCQAVQNMNLMFGLPEDCGLRFKASAF